MRDALTRMQASRIEREALARWRRAPATPIDDIARDLSLSLHRVRVGVDPERLPDTDQVRFFAILSVVAVTRVIWLRTARASKRSALDRLRDFDAS